MNHLIEIFEYALHIAGNPEICYMIGDNPVADIQGGKGAGMKTILVHNNVSAEFCKDNMICENLIDVIKIID